MTRKTAFFEGWPWFKFNNLGLALGTNLKFYTSVQKWLKLKVKTFWGLFSTFAEVTGEKLVWGAFLAQGPITYMRLLFDLKIFLVIIKSKVLFHFLWSVRFWEYAIFVRGFLWQTTEKRPVLGPPNCFAMLLCY